jgi:hypothetical protein
MTLITRIAAKHLFAEQIMASRACSYIGYPNGRLCVIGGLTDMEIFGT